MGLGDQKQLRELRKCTPRSWFPANTLTIRVQGRAHSISRYLCVVGAALNNRFVGFLPASLQIVVNLNRPSPRPPTLLSTLRIIKNVDGLTHGVGEV